MENQKGARGHPGLGAWKEHGVLGKSKPLLLAREGSPVQEPAPPFRAASRWILPMGLPRLTDECPGMVGGRSFWTNGGSGLGLWSVGRKKVGSKEESREEGEEVGGAQVKFLLLHLAPSVQNHLQNPGEAESEDRERTEREWEGTKGQWGWWHPGPLSSSEFPAPMFSPLPLPGSPLNQAAQAL